MRRQDAAFVVHQRDFGALDLARAETAAQLAHGFDDAEQAAGGAGMRMRQHAAVRVDRQLAADTACPSAKKAPPSPGLQKPSSSSSMMGTMVKQS